MQDYDNFNDLQLDIIREVGNIGAGNAATALAGLLNDKVSISVPELKVVDVNKISSILGGPEKEAVGILVNMTNEASGMLLFIIGKEFASLLITTLLNEELNSFDDMSQMGMSALMEIGNILSGSYINAMSNFTDLDIRLSTPQITIDMVGAILSYPAALFGEMGDKLLLIEENFISSCNIIKSHLLIMPELKSLDLMLKRLGVV
jgi:chemotaxis protein CheC